MVVGLFIWALGVGSTNPWLIYNDMYTAAKKDSRKGTPLLPKWSHCEFIKELVYGLLFPDQSRAQVEKSKAMSVKKFCDSVKTTSSMSLFGNTKSPLDHKWDFLCQARVDKYLDKVKQSTMNCMCMQSNYFHRRFDGFQHPTVCSIFQSDRSQYFYYQWVNEFTNEHKEVTKYMKNDQKNIWRFLVCNVNLCQFCESKLHGVRMGDSEAMLGRKELFKIITVLSWKIIPHT